MAYKHSLCSKALVTSSNINVWKKRRGERGREERRGGEEERRGEERRGEGEEGRGGIGREEERKEG